MHMKRYPGFLHDVNAEGLPQLPADSSTTPSPGQAGCFTGCYVPSPHHAQMAAKHQQAVAILLRSDDDKHGATITLPSDFDEFVWDAMRGRNEERDRRPCETVPLPDIALGPGHVGWKLIQESEIAFNDEQIDCIALCVWDLEEAFRKHQGGASSPAVLPGSQILTGAQLETIRSQCLLPNGLGLPRTLIVGGGGCGKTTMLLEVICPTYETFFERIARATPSNKSARLFMAKPSTP